jgi:uncharacterized membrane protein YbhN (UPF0104 family)
MRFEVHAGPTNASKPNVAAKAGIGAITLRQFAMSAILLLLALACTVALAAWSGLSMPDVIETLAATPLWLIAVFTALTVAQVALSAWKWQLVLHKLRPGEHEDMSFAFLYNCSALAAFLSQFLTVYLSSILVRGWAFKRTYGLTARYATTTSLFEQMFDVVALFVMVLPTLLVWSFDGTFSQWAVATAVAIAAGALSFRFFGLVSLGATLAGRIHPAMEKLSSMLEQSAASGLLSLPFMLKMYAISLVRYFTMLARIPVLTVAFGLPLAMADVVPGFTIVQATQIAALTPGQLGIREWTWSGVLALRGYDLQLSAGFAIDLRIAGTVAIALATLTCIGGLHQRRS